MSLKVLTSEWNEQANRFNPCCNGMSLKVLTSEWNEQANRFNPCCNGMSLKGFDFPVLGNVEAF